ncbi:M20/M25/M40 family metallo-hydrolase [Alphaproteobacteria bacterium]|nr:M20/M25/M40 family metallo-hydrolase [Alphaproteobacteria bacterium]
MQINNEDNLNDLLEFLSIEGITGKEKKIAIAVKNKLISYGIPEEYIFFDEANKKIPLPTETGNLIVKLPGTKIGKRILFSTHLDTVSLCKGVEPIIYKNRIIPKQKTALGADNRGGVGCLVNMLKYIFNNNVDYLPITVLFTVREESGLWGARNVTMEDLGFPIMGFNTDGASPYEIITSAVGAERWSVEIFGKGSHAGVAPEKGISATIVASLALNNIYKEGWFGKIKKEGQEGTSNIGYYGDSKGNCAGSSTNQVTDYVKINGESRSNDERFVSKITKVFEKSFVDASKLVKNSNKETSKILFTSNVDYYPFELEKNLNVVKYIKNSANKIQLKSDIVSCNGGLDANWLVKKGIPTVTFGNGHYNPHSLDEYLEISEYYDSCKLAISLAIL